MLWSRIVVFSQMLLLACGGGQKPPSHLDDTSDIGLKEVSLDLQQREEAKGETLDTMAAEVLDTHPDGRLGESTDGTVDLEDGNAFDNLIDGGIETADSGCTEPNTIKVESPRVLAGPGSVTLAALVARPGGGYVVAVNSDAEDLTWGGEVVDWGHCSTLDGCADALVIWLDESLDVERTYRIHGGGSDRLLALAIDPSGQVLAAGTTESPQLLLGSSALLGQGMQDALALAFDAGGEFIWALRTGGEMDDAWNTVTSDGQGGAVVGGWFESNTLQVGGKLLTGKDDNCILLDCGDLMLAGISGDGEVAWTRAMGGNQGERFVSLHAGQGSYNVVGSFGSWGLNLGGDELLMQETICGPMFGCSDIFAGSFGAAGEHLWSKGFGGDLLDVALAGAPTPDGGLLLLGEFSSSSLDLGGGPLVNNGDHESFVASLDAEGVHQWSRQADAFLQAAVSGPEDRTIIMGRQAEYQTGFAACPSLNDSGSQLIAGIIDGTGALASHHTFGANVGPLQIGGLAIGGDSLAVGGTFQGELTLPGVNPVSTSYDAVFLFLVPASLTLPETI